MVSRGYSLLAGRVVAVSLKSACSSFPAGCSNSMIATLIQTSSLSAAHGAVASQIPQVALLWLSRKTSPHLQYRIRELWTERQ